MHELRLVEHHGFDEPEILAAAAFDHVSRECPGTAREADQRDLAVQFYLDPALPSYVDRLTLSYTMFVKPSS